MQLTAPKHIGFEIELGNHLLKTGSTNRAGRAADALVRAHHRHGGTRHGQHTAGTQEFDGSGFRFYRDHDHAEIASPLVQSATLLTCAMRDARSIVATAKRIAEAEVGPMRVSYNNTNRQDTAWAFHGNVLVARPAFDAWRRAGWEPLKKQWVPFLVTSLPLVGTGKVGVEKHNKPACRYQFSQRADFIDEEIGLSTTAHKNLVNTRDEPLSDPQRYARLHVIAWDTNLCEFATWLKFGITQLLLSLIEEDVGLPVLTLKDPLRATRIVSRDLALKKPLRLQTGRRETALGIQRRLAEATARHLEKGCAATEVPDAAMIVEKWIETLDDLAARAAHLNHRLDWCAKLQVLRRASALRDLDHEQALVVDLRYGEVGGLFEKLEKAGDVEALEDFLPQESWPTNAPRLLPREHARAVFVNRFGRHLVEVDWDHIVARNTDEMPWYIAMEDPLGGHALLQAVSEARDWAHCMRTLIRTSLAVPAVAIQLVSYTTRADPEQEPERQVATQETETGGKP